MTNELHLDEFRILDIKKDEDGSMLYLVEPDIEETACLNCGSINTVCNGTLTRYVRDLPSFGNSVALMVKQHRYLCRDCGKTCVHELQSVENKERITIRLREQVKIEALNSTFLAVGVKYGLSATSVKKIFDEYVSDKQKEWVKYSPEILRIDEAHLCNQMRGVFVDVQNRGLIEMLPKRDKVSVIEYLNSLPHHERIKVVTMDMWRPYRDAVNEVLPRAMIVIDKFHVIKEVNNALESYRKEFQKSLTKERRISLKNSRWLMLHNAEVLDNEERQRLERLFAVYPELRLPYQLKESFRDIYQSGDRYIAEEKFERWCESIPEDLAPFLSVKETVCNWYNEIFNYFDYPYTNAITESINNLIKSIEKAGRGYTFDVIRAKILYSTKATRMPVYKAKPNWRNCYGYVSLITFEDDKELVCGTMSDCAELAGIIRTWKNPQSSEL